MLKWTKQQQQNLQLFQNHSQPSSNTQNSLNSTNFPNLSTYKTSTDVSSKSRKKSRYTTSSAHPSQPQKMPTMTHTLERRIHRRSLDNLLDSPLEERRRSRHSLTGNHNKENFGVHFMRNSFGNTSLTALHDLSNGKSPRRSQEQATTTPPAPPLTLNIKRFNTAAVTAMDITPTRNNNAGGEVRSRFSDDFAQEDDVTPLSRLKFRNKLKEDSLSSSRMGDVTLDRMLDAIIESARKEVKPKCLHKRMEETNQQENPANEESIHEMEVRTPQHLKRQRVVRRKNPKNTVKKNKKEKAKEDSKILNKTLEELEVKKDKRENEMIGLTLPNGIPSPETPLFKNSQTQKALLNMETPPQHLTFEVENDIQRCSTPTLEEVPSIKRCLSFSCNSEEEDEYQHMHKRSSVASSIASSTQEQLSGSSSSLTANNVKGSLDVAIYKEQESLNVHVIRCRDLQRSNGSSNLNAYVKVALIQKNQTEHQGFQRTAVHRHSSRPYFDHCFKFDLSDLSQALEDLDDSDRLQMAVWHRDRQHK
ncbi:uncharacterized protein LOC124418686 [Lucilia cuprina]|uniref:uncharacterized protein LOC124418686 n=1 Tax=Lucilia cuprina TaxID=7375 RepID=UPI001F06427E|nr:uncharacterized protein LOC124418686 [Lucilia cuprina]